MEMDDEEAARARVGAVLNDKWTLEKLLGVGGMAAVYEARHRNGARAAIKVLHRALSLEPTLRERFVHEGYAANRVEHADVVKILDDDTIQGGDDDGVPFLVLELLEGRSLEDRLGEKPPVTERELLEMVDTVLGVLESAHARGIIHRDLKPENLFLVADPESGRVRVKVVDFGIARSMEGRGATVHGIPMGTPAFMAPEQASGRIDDIDGRTDLFALGSTMFTVLAGRAVHEGEDPLDVMYRVAKEQAVPIRSVAPNVSEACARIVDRALRLDRNERYADAAEMRADVRAILATPVEESPPPPVPSQRSEPRVASLANADTIMAAPPPAVVAHESVPPPPKSGCAIWVLLVLALGAVALVAVWFALGQPWPPFATSAADGGAVEAGAGDAAEERPAPSASASVPAVVDAAPPPVIDAAAEAAADDEPDATTGDAGPADGALALDAGDGGAKPATSAAPTTKPTVPGPTVTTKPTVTAHPTTTKPKPKH